MKLVSKPYLYFCSLLLLAGCADYAKPPISVDNISYTKLQEKEKSLIPPDIKLLTLGEAQQIALANNQDFKSIQFSLDSARSRYFQSMSYYAPTLNAGMTISQSFNRTYSSHNTPKNHGQSESYQPGISGQLLIFDCLAREFNLLAAKVGVHQAQSNIDDAKRILLRAVAYAYNDIQLALTQRQIIQAQLNYSIQMLEEARNKYNAGTTLLSDVNNFEITRKNSELELIAINYNIKANKYILAGYLGLTDGTIPEHIEFPDITMPEDVFLPNVEFYIDQALKNRPDLKVLRDQFKISKYNYWTTIANLGPTINGTYQLNYNQSRNLSHGSDGARTSSNSGSGGFGYGLNASWVLFDGFANYNNIKIAAANMAQADYNQAQNWIDIITEVRNAYENYVSSVEAAKLSQQIYQLTLETRNLVDNEYNAGTALVTRVNQAETALVQAQNNLATAIVNISNAQAQLDAAIYGSMQREEESKNEKNN